MPEFYLVTILGEALQNKGKGGCFWKKTLCLIRGRVSAQVWMKPGAQRWLSSGLFFFFFKIVSIVLCTFLRSLPFLPSPILSSPVTPMLPISGDTDRQAGPVNFLQWFFHFLGYKKPSLPPSNPTATLLQKKLKEVKRASALKELKSCVRIRCSRLSIHNPNSETPNPKLLEYQVEKTHRRLDM